MQIGDSQEFRNAIRCLRPLDSLLGSLRGCLDGFPDKRRGINTTYPMGDRAREGGDIGMAAFSVFFMQSPSFLAHQRQFEAGHGRSNCTSLFGIRRRSPRPGVAELSPARVFGRSD